MAIFVLVTAILGVYTAIASSRQLSLVSERHAAMTQVAQKEIERIEGTDYSAIGMSSAPSTSTDSTNPDYYVVSGSPPSYKYNRSSSTTEQLDVDSTKGIIAPISKWAEGGVGGSIYDFITWTTDSACSPSCPSSQDYKRITVAVTMNSGLLPTPVYVSSVIADPTATPPGGCTGGSCGNPLIDPTSTCKNSAGTTVSCSAGIDQGTANTWYLHACAATNSSCAVPSANKATNATSGPISGQTCTTSTSLAGHPSQRRGLPDSGPDGRQYARWHDHLIALQLLHRSVLGQLQRPGVNHDAVHGELHVRGRRLLQPTCSGGCTAGVARSAPAARAHRAPEAAQTRASDCTNSWSNTYLNVQSEFWATPALTSALTLSGYGGLTMSTPRRWEQHRSLSASAWGS